MQRFEEVWKRLFQLDRQSRDDKILSRDEYWGDDGIAPHWRLDKKIGKPIAISNLRNRVKG